MKQVSLIKNKFLTLQINGKSFEFLGPIYNIWTNICTMYRAHAFCINARDVMHVYVVSYKTHI